MRERYAAVCYGVMLAFVMIFFGEFMAQAQGNDVAHQMINLDAQGPRPQRLSVIWPETLSDYL